MLTIYAIPVSLYCAKLRILLRHKGLEWQEIPPPGGYGSVEYNALVPAGNLPALRHDGLLIADSEAIAEYLEEVFPDPAMLPGTPSDRARARARSRFHDTRLEPAVRALFSDIGKAVAPTVTAEKTARIEKRLGELATLLAQEPAGADLTLGDCGFPITATWIDALTPIMGLTVAWPDGVRRYLADLQKHPAVATELQSYGDALRNWLAREAGG